MIEFDSKGDVTNIALRADGVNLVSPSDRSPLLQLKCDGKLFPPNKATWDSTKRALTLSFEPIAAIATVLIEPKRNYTRLELLALKSSSRI